MGTRPCGERGALTPALKVFALVMDRMHLGSVGKHWHIMIKDDGIGLPCLPQPRDYAGELIGDVVSFIVRVVFARLVLTAPSLLLATVQPIRPSVTWSSELTRRQQE